LKRSGPNFHFESNFVSSALGPYIRSIANLPVSMHENEQRKSWNEAQASHNDMMHGLDLSQVPWSDVPCKSVLV
jgi:hypothetical protein